MATVRVIKTKEEIQQLGVLNLLKDHFEHYYTQGASQLRNLEHDRDVFWLFDRDIPIYDRSNKSKSVFHLLQDIGLMDNSDKVNDDVKMLDLIMANDPYVTSGQITNEEMEELKVLRETDLCACITLLGYIIATGNLLDIKRILLFARNPDVKVERIQKVEATHFQNIPPSISTHVNLVIGRIQEDVLMDHYTFSLPVGEVDIIDDLLVSLDMDMLKFSKLKFSNGRYFVNSIGQERIIKLLDHPLDIIGYTDSVHVREITKLLH